MKVNFPDAQCVVVCETISRKENYRFYQHRAAMVSAATRQYPRTLRNCHYREYRCSQSANYRASDEKHPDPRKQRNRQSMELFHCEGTIKFVFRPLPEFVLDDMPIAENCPLRRGELLFEFKHKLQHPGRVNIIIPEAIRAWLMTSQHATPREAFRDLRRMVERGEFPDIAGHLITPHNVTYHWTLALQTRIGTKGDPWMCAFDYLNRKPNVSVSNAMC